MQVPERYLDGTRAALLRSVEEFARRELAPLAPGADERPEENDILKIMPGAFELGLLDALLPAERGGQGMDAFTFLLALAELSSASAAAAALLLSHNLSLQALELSGMGPEVEEGSMPPLHCLAFAARWREGERGLEGGCDFAPGLPLAGRIAAVSERGEVALFAGTDPGVREGYRFEHGLRAARPAALLLESARPELEGSMTREGLEGMEALLEMGAAAMCAGIVCASLSASAAYAGQRYQGGDLIERHQQVRLMLGEMEVSREAAFALLAGAAGWEGREPGLRTARAARLLLSEMALRSATDAVQLHGGYGYMREQGMERLMRDASLLRAWPLPPMRALL